MAEIDLALLNDFIVEAREHLNEMEAHLLQLGANPHDKTRLNAIFTDVHTIKGAAQFVGLDNVSVLAHKVEDLLDLLRQGQLLADHRIIDLLIEARDRLELLVGELETAQVEITPVDDLMAQLQSCLAGEPVPAAVEATEPDAVEGEDSAFAPDHAGLDPDLLPIWVENANAQLPALAANLMQLQLEPTNVELIQESFNHLQVLKGVAEFIGLSQTTALTAQLCAVLAALADNPHRLSTELLALLVESSQRLQLLATELEQFQLEASPVDDLLAQLTAVDQVDQADKGEYAEGGRGSVLPQQLLSQDCVDENDQELLDIFLSQLRDKVGIIQLNQPLLTEREQSGSAWANIQESVQALMSSANYMGYDSLTQFYGRWLAQLKTVEPNQSNQTTLDWSFVADYLQQLVQAFPQLDDLARIAPVTDTQPIPAEGDEIAQSAPGDTLFARLSEALEHSLEHSLDHEGEGEADSLHALLDELLPSPPVLTQPAVKAVPVAIEPSVIAPPVALTALEPDIAIPPAKANEPIFKKSIRVDSGKIDTLMNQVGELIVDRGFFQQLFNELRGLQRHLKSDLGLTQKELKPVRAFALRFAEAIVALGRTSNELQERVMKVRMLPIAQLFNRYPRLIHDLVHGTDKKVKLEVRGEDTELDKMIIEEISDPLIHIIRNAIDHGIEPAAERKALGKPESATLLLNAYHESNHIVIEISDDGRGIDVDKIKAKALEKSLYRPEELARMSNRELMQLILIPGFSTAEQISKTSGRGVGMDVVKKNIEKLNGILEINSKKGSGSRISLKIPLTLAIIRALQVRVGSSFFTIPLSNVEETLSVHEDELSTLENTKVIHLRGKTLPVFWLSRLFQIAADPSQSNRFYVVVVNTGIQQIGLVVDQLLGQDEVVIKPIVDYLQEQTGFSGATIIGDGRISLILDIYQLVKMTIHQQIERHQEQDAARKRKLQPTAESLH